MALNKIALAGEVTIGQRLIGYWPNRVYFCPGYVSKSYDNGKKYYHMFDGGDERYEEIFQIPTF